MSKSIQLYIPEPCHENWNTMTVVEKGRFCGSCQKKVIDFSMMSDEQVVAFFRKPATGSVCGRFMEDQLERDMDIPGKRIPWLKYFFQFALPAFLVSSKAVAQEEIVIIPEKTSAVKIPKKTSKDIANSESLVKELLIKGRIINSQGEGIPYASVFIIGPAIGTAADSTGFFTVGYKGNLKHCILESSAIGFKKNQTSIELTKNEKGYEIQLEDDNELQGITVKANLKSIDQTLSGKVGGLMIVEEKNYWETSLIKLFSTTKPPKLFPNPITINTVLTIDMSRQRKGDYSIQLVTISGEMLLYQRWTNDESNRLIKVDIPNIPSGTYVVRIINTKSNKSTSEKLIVR